MKTAAPIRTATRADWLAARKQLLVKEKQLTRLGDDLARQRRELPWVEVTEAYEFEGPQGKQTLAGLFGAHSQLFVYHFMFGPDWEQGCKSCSLVADHLDRSVIHLAHRDVALIGISRAPWPQIRAFQQRMGWTFPWYSSHGSRFNFDYDVSCTEAEVEAGTRRYNFGTIPAFMDELPGASVFAKGDDGRVYHTYSTYGRGLEPMLLPYYFLDRTPKGRDEDGFEMPMTWVRHHDRYDLVEAAP